MAQAGNYSTSNKRESPMDFQLPMSDDYPLEEGAELQAGRYYRPRSTNFPMIDSVFYDNPTGEQPILLVFQFTRNKDKHDAEKTGFHRLENLKIASNTHRYHVVVTPDGIQPDIRIPKDYFPKEDRKREPDTVFPIFHYPVSEGAVFPPTPS
jgi:hypothetical protein